MEIYIENNGFARGVSTGGLEMPHNARSPVRMFILTRIFTRMVVCVKMRMMKCDAQPHQIFHPRNMLGPARGYFALKPLLAIMVAEDMQL